MPGEQLITKLPEILEEVVPAVKNTYQSLRGTEPIYHGTQNIFKTFKPSNEGLLRGLIHFSENPTYAELYSTGWHSGGPLSGKRFISNVGDVTSKSLGKARPNIISGIPDAKHVLDLTKPLSQSDFDILSQNLSGEQIQKLTEAYHNADPYANVWTLDDITNAIDNPDTLGKLPYDAYRYRAHGQLNWAVSPKTKIETPWKVKLKGAAALGAASSMPQQNQQVQSGQDVTDLMNVKSGDDVTNLMNAPAPTPTTTTTAATPASIPTPQTMPDASKMLKTGLGGAWEFMNTPAIPEPTEEDWRLHPYGSYAQKAGSFLTTPMMAIPEMAGAGFLGLKGIGKLRGAGKLGKIAEETVAPAAKEGDILGQQGLRDVSQANEIAPAIKPRIRANTDGTFTNMNTGEVITPNKPFEPGAPVSVQFNPKGQTGLTGQAQAAKLPPEPEVGHEITLKTQGQAPIIKRFQDMGYVPGGVNSEERPIMIYKGEQVPIENLPLHPEEKIGLARELYNMPRGMASIDPPFLTSAAFRQALPQIGTKNWFKAWVTSAKSYGSTATHEQLMSRINAMPEFKRNVVTDFVGGKWVNKEQPSFADKIGLRMTDLGGLTGPEEMLASKRLEKWVGNIPLYGRHFKASNRAYGGFLNDLRANMLHDMVLDSQAKGIDPFIDLTRGKEIADYINNTTGRGSLRFKLGSKELNLEGSAKILAEGLYSPRLIASRINMLNPSTYIMASPQIRQAYMKSMARMIGGWWGLASLAEMSGMGSVSKDPNNADYGKIRIGNTRLDPGGGFQQYLVLGSRMRPSWAKLPVETDTGVTAVDLLTNLLGTGGGKYTSSTSGRSRGFGEGYKPETRMSTALNFAANKLHPTAKLIYDVMAAQQGRPVYLGDRTAQLFIPMVAQDMVQIMKDDPSLIPLIGAGLFTGTGGGLQTYESYETKPLLTSPEWDIAIKGN